MGASFAVVDVVRLPPVHHTEQENSPWRRLPRPPARACFPSSCPKLSCFPTTLPRQARQPQHSSHEPEVASTDLVKLDKASQLVPTDVIRWINSYSAVLVGIPQQALLKAYEEAANEEE